LSIAEVNALLPSDFIPIHRCYTVNSRDVAAVRRYNVTLGTGEKLPTPRSEYNDVKAAFLRQIIGRQE